MLTIPCMINAKTIDLSDETFRFASAHLAGSILSNGNAGTTNFESSARNGKISAFLKKNLFYNADVKNTISNISEMYNNKVVPVINNFSDVND